MLFIGAIAFSPRIPLPIMIPGRCFDLRVEDIILSGLLFFWLLSLFLRPRIYLAPLFKAIGIYVSIVVLTTGIAVIRFDLNLPRVFFYFLKELEYFLIFLLVANWVRSYSDLKFVGNAILTVGFVNAVWVGYQVLTKRMVPLFFVEAPAGVYQPPHLLESYGPGLFGEVSPLSVGGFFLLVFLLALSYTLVSRPGFRRRLCVLLSATFLVCVLLSGSRVSTIGVIIGALVFVRYWGNKKSVMIMGLGFPVLLGAVLWRKSNVFYSMEHIFNFKHYVVSLAFRQQEIWQPLVSYISENPLLGLLGFGRSSLGFFPGFPEEAHNHYLKVLLEHGVFGLIAFLWLLTVVISLSRRVHKRSRTSISKVIGGASLAATVALSVGALVQDVFKPVILNELWWVFVGLTAAAYRIESRSITEKNNV
ncbi:MAG: O-antigen ligase family protein [Thermodesulfovibrionales bacterium]|nr:O-antigen ligase family protein [Thermodesulfovibrionales bacterium]